MPSDAERPRLAIIGGTGPEGRGLATRFARLGFSIIVGSRISERGQEVADTLRDSVDDAHVTGGSNLDAARQGEIVVLTIPFGGIADTLPPLCNPCAGKIVVSAIAPVEWRDGKPVALRPEAGSAAQEVQSFLPESRVVSAFQTIDAHQLRDANAPLDSDIIVCSDDQEARREVVRIAGMLPGVRALSGGRLASARYVEEVTALLITVNRIYKTHSGFRLTGIDR